MDQNHRHDRSCNWRCHDRRELIKNERGVALILALTMLFILTLLGVFSLNNTTTDLHIAGNYRNQQIAMYNADVVDGYGVSNQNIIGQILPGTVNSYPSTTNPNVYSYITATMPTAALGSGTPVSQGSSQFNVTYLCTSAVPRGLACSNCVAHHYVVRTVGLSANNSEMVVESDQIRIQQVDENTLNNLPWPSCQ